MTGRSHHLRGVLLPFGERPVDLWVTDGRVTFEPVAGAERCGPEGAFIAPGLVDAHTHLHFIDDPQGETGRGVIERNRRAHLEAGTLLLRDLGATSDLVLALRDDDGLPLVRSAGRCLLVEPRFPFTVTLAKELPGAVSSLARAGARWVKIFADWPGWPGGEEEPDFGRDHLSYPAETLADAVRAAHTAGARVAIHAFGRDGAEAGLEAGVDSIEHGWGLDEAMLSRMAAQRIAWTPMFGISRPMYRGAKRSRPHQAEWIVQTLRRMRTLVPFAHAAGVPVLAGTDWFPAVTLADELDILRQLGLSSADALAAATTVPRTFLGEPALVEGARADLVLYREDPRADLRRVIAPDVVMLGGVVTKGAA